MSTEWPPSSEPKEIDLGKVAEQELGEQGLAPEKLPTGPEIGDKVRVSDAESERLGKSFGICEVAGSDPKDPTKVIVHSLSTGDTISVYKAGLTVIDAKAFEEQSKAYNVPEHAKDIEHSNGK